MSPLPSPLCDLCRHRLPLIPRPKCARCWGPVGSGGECPACRDWPPELVRAVAPHGFEGTAARTVRAHKYGRWRSAARPMIGAMSAAAAPAIDAVSIGSTTILLTPVPLSPARWRERGFNQAEDLSLGIADQLGLDHAHLLSRSRGASRQAGAGADRRQSNVQGQFDLARGSGYSGDGSEGVILVDDVLTTGATILACARVLHEAGFGRIAALTFARTLRTPDPAAGHETRHDRGRV